MIGAFVYTQIRNMAEKVPSFKTSGTRWFTDLTTADTTYILPLLTAIIFIIMKGVKQMNDKSSLLIEMGTQNFIFF